MSRIISSSNLTLGIVDSFHESTPARFCVRASDDSEEIQMLGVGCTGAYFFGIIPFFLCVSGQSVEVLDPLSIVHRFPFYLWAYDTGGKAEMLTRVDFVTHL